MVAKKDYSKIVNDLHSFSSRDLQTMYSYYKVNSFSDLVSRIYKKGNLLTIFDAIQEGDIDSFNEIINTLGFNINITDGDGNSALLSTISNERTEMAKILIEKGINLNIQNQSGSTALTISIGKNNTEIAKLLIDKGANLNLISNWGTALTLAIRNKKNEMAKLLINKGANLDTQGSSLITALMDAIYKNNNEIAKLLIDKGANLNLQRSDTGYTALMEAIEFKNYEIAKLLINPGTRPGADLTLKAEPDPTVPKGETALNFIDSLSPELLVYIIKKNIKIPVAIRRTMKNYTELKTFELNNEIQLLKSLMSASELELLGTIKICSSTEVEDLEECKKAAVNVIKYRPGEKKMKKLESKYKEHPYFQK